MIIVIKYRTSMNRNKKYCPSPNNFEQQCQSCDAYIPTTKRLNIGDVDDDDDDGTCCGTVLLRCDAMKFFHEG